ncbi:SPOR domain-containing protein [Sphingobium nicotianae]|uniref:SPOR domain-containing protein n=1 Tax=Sphingobium nicotianae TaxID=2782607 RepID=A0A9X1AI72_9SPHN|nr:SPOR domain-containing protein [Sphingobium nicotianae]MBT2185697.1 SPOR domain-containing protein [Sphingobium nicotianae]
MRRQTLSTMMASAAILGSSMVGCSGARMENRPAIAANQAPSLAPRVEKALAEKDYARALMQAEELVAAQPNEAGYRALLGRAYLANGRYDSARTAFKDAMTLGNRDVRTIISLSLAETGLGDAAGARALLADHISDLPAADYGLAMAMAGDPREGVRALMEAVKQPDSTAQTRQNLAYAMALAGAWGQARLIAGQDMSAREAEARIGQWSQAAQAGNEQGRVVAMIGVSPRADDAGLPTRLALGGNGAPMQMAAAAPVDLVAQARHEVAPAAPAPQAVAAAAPVEASPSTMAVAMSFDANNGDNAPLVKASSDPMRLAARAAFQRTRNNDARAMVARADMSRITTVIAPAPDAKASDWVVQLGAFDTAEIAKAKWQQISRGKSPVGGFREIHSEFSLNGRAFHRLAIRGFGDRTSADAACRSLRAEGQACFVRLDDTNTTRMARAQAQKGAPQMAARKPVAAPKVAARIVGAGRQIAAR